MILKIILYALCANLLYTNANLMLAATQNKTVGFSILMVLFALTYSLISTLSLFKLQSALTAICFAVLDGFAVYTHLSEHGQNFNSIVGVYFGVYTSYILIVAYIIKRHDDKKKVTIIDGHDVEYWHRCFLIQKEKADAKEQHSIEIEKPKIQNAISQFSDEEQQLLLSTKRAFARMKDEDKRREKIETLPENVKTEIEKIYNL